MTQVIPGVVAPYQSPEKIRSRDVQMTVLPSLKLEQSLFLEHWKPAIRRSMVTYDLPSEGE